MIVEVDDPADPRLTDYVGLRDQRTPEGVVIVEGIVALGQLVRSAYPVRSLLVLPSQLSRVEPFLGDRDVAVFVAGRDVLETTVGFNLHRGVVAAADRIPLPEPAALWRDARRVVIVEDLTDHENLGSVFRNAAAFGIDAVLLSPRCADPLYRRSVRVSLGHVLHVPFAWLADWPAAVDQMRSDGLSVVALTPDPASDPIATLGRPERVVVLLGTEGPGLSSAALAAADRRAHIPMAPGVDSLNVATAAAIVLYALR